MAEKKILTGNHAVSYGAMLARAQVISAYPITPQTTIVELLSELVASGRLNAKFINVESEHSAMAACVAASAAGARAFTATSAQGLALMHEMLHWAVGARTPVVLANVNRAMGPPWSIWSEQTDFVSQRDVGWIQLFAESVQESQDFIIWLYRVTEQVFLPGMVALDAFILSHTFEPLVIHDQDKVDEFLPPFKPVYDLDPKEPRAWGGLANRDHYFEMRYKIYKQHQRALNILRETGQEFGQVFGTSYDVVEEFMTEDADYILVSAGAMSSNVRFAVKQLRDKGQKVGMMRLIALRPFPDEAVQKILSGRKKVAVLDRNMSPGRSGVIAQEIKTALFHREDRPPVFSYVIGIGGRDITVSDIIKVYEDLLQRDEILDQSMFVGVKGLDIGPGPDMGPVRQLPELPEEAAR